MQRQLTNCYLRYHKIGLIPGQPSGNLDGKNPGTWSKVGAKPRVPSEERDLMLGIDSCTPALELNMHKTIRRIECSRYCCGQ